jgi:hypothetical protein
VAVFIAGGTAEVTRLAGAEAVDDHHVGQKLLDLRLDAGREDRTSRSDHREVRHVVVAGPKLLD